MKFTQIKGWNLALFKYEDDNGAESVYTEFVQDGVIFTVTACGLENNELGLALASILPPKEDISEPRTATGTVTHVDSRTNESHDYITVECDGTQLTVWLPSEADRFSVGDHVTVTYNGEPATAHNIWPGQLINVE